MPSDLTGRVIIVAGATRGMGQSIVRGIVASGGKAVFGGRDTASGENIAAQLGDNARFVTLDVSEEDHWRNGVAAAIETFGRLDGLVNCAGVSIHGSVEENNLADINKLVATNQTSFLIGMKHAVPAMRAAGGGSIVNIGSLAATRGFPGLTAYGATKGAISAMTRSAALELASAGIRVNTIHPGPFMTKMLKDRLGDQAEALSPQLAPLGRAGDPNEMIGPVVFLLSDDSSYVTGAEIAVDGGRAL